MRFYCDEGRHLVCMPYSVDALHEMAAELGIHRRWFHRSKHGLHHYDIPRRRVQEIKERCTVVSSEKVVDICRGRITPFTILTEALTELSRQQPQLESTRDEAS